MLCLAAADERRIKVDETEGEAGRDERRGGEGRGGEGRGGEGKPGLRLEAHELQWGPAQRTTQKERAPTNTISLDFRP